MLLFVLMQMLGICINQENKKVARDGQLILFGFVGIHKIDYHIITQDIRVYYLKAPAPKERFC